MQSSLADLMLLEIDELPGVPLEDTREVSRYVAALEHQHVSLLSITPTPPNGDVPRPVERIMSGGSGFGCYATLR